MSCAFPWIITFSVLFFSLPNPTRPLPLGLYAPAFLSILPLRACCSFQIRSFPIPSKRLMQIEICFRLKTKDGLSLVSFFSPWIVHHPRSEFISPMHHHLIAGVGLAFPLST